MSVTLKIFTNSRALHVKTSHISYGKERSDYEKLDTDSSMYGVQKIHTGEVRRTF